MRTSAATPEHPMAGGRSNDVLEHRVRGAAPAGNIEPELGADGPDVDRDREPSIDVLGGRASSNGRIGMGGAVPAS